MKKYRMKATNEVSAAKWNTIKLTHMPFITTNSAITPAMFERECKLYDAGLLPTEHERYIGEQHG